MAIIDDENFLLYINVANIKGKENLYMSLQIYVANDGKNIRELIEAFLTREGFSITTYQDANPLLDACLKAISDLVILDIMIPGTDEFSICSTIRKMG